MKESKKNAKVWIKPFILGVVIITLIIVSNRLGLGEKLGDLKDWIKSIGIWGPVVFISIYTISTVALIPGSAMTVAAGAMFGSVMGVVVASLASISGAVLSFLVARYFARESVAKWLEKQEKFRKLDELTEKHGSIIVAITRLVPLFPFTLLNYGFGMTKVPFKIYVLWSWLCMIPGTIMYVVGSDAIVTATREGKVPWALVFVFASIIIIIAFLVRHARNILQKKESDK